MYKYGYLEDEEVDWNPRPIFLPFFSFKSCVWRFHGVLGDSIHWGPFVEDGKVFEVSSCIIQFVCKTRPIEIK